MSLASRLVATLRGIREPEALGADPAVAQDLKRRRMDDAVVAAVTSVYTSGSSPAAETSWLIQALTELQRDPLVSGREEPRASAAPAVLPVASDAAALLARSANMESCLDTVANKKLPKKVFDLILTKLEELKKVVKRVLNLTTRLESTLKDAELLYSGKWPPALTRFKLKVDLPEMSQPMPSTVKIGDNDCSVGEIHISFQGLSRRGARESSIVNLYPGPSTWTFTLFVWSWKTTARISTAPNS